MEYGWPQVLNYYIIFPKQFGFRFGYSFSTALFDVLDDKVNAGDCGGATVLMTWTTSND